MTSERVASSTAVLVCQGRAVADGRMAGGRFGDPVAYELLDPPERVLVDDVRAGRAPAGGAERMVYEMVRGSATVMVPRTIAIDDAIREHAAGQVVILGAGLDARAWRLPELAAATVFEVDHPASQQDKLRRAGDRAPTAGRWVPVAVDLATDGLARALEAAGFDRARPSTWVWEGVIPYLTVPQVKATLERVSSLASSNSRLIVNYQTSSLWLRALRGTARVAMRVFRAPDLLAGEPWRSLWNPGSMAVLLGDHGFDVTSDRDLLDLATGLDLPGASTGSLRNGRVAVAERR